MAGDNYKSANPLQSTITLHSHILDNLETTQCIRLGEKTKVLRGNPGEHANSAHTHRAEAGIDALTQLYEMTI